MPAPLSVAEFVEMVRKSEVADQALLDAQLAKLGGALPATPQAMADLLVREAVLSSFYGLGATFYFCLTGQPPFGNGTVEQTVRAHRKTPPVPVRTRRPEVPQALSDLIDRMLAKAPEDRRPHRPSSMHSRRGSPSRSRRRPQPRCRAIPRW
jgi:serine/threonine protein kinase